MPTSSSFIAPVREISSIEPILDGHFASLCQAVARYGFTWKRLNTNQQPIDVRFRASFRDRTRQRFHLELFASRTRYRRESGEEAVQLFLGLYLVYPTDEQETHEHLLPAVSVECGALGALEAKPENLRRLLNHHFDVSVAASIANERLRC